APGKILHQRLEGTRCSYAEWMGAIKASPKEQSVVRSAFARWGGKKDPSPSDVIEAHTGYATPEQRARFGQLSHGLVLMAAESKSEAAWAPPTCPTIPPSTSLASGRRRWARSGRPNRRRSLTWILPQSPCGGTSRSRNCFPRSHAQVLAVLDRHEGRQPRHGL